MPKLSVVIPVYNVERVLERCVESVLSQTYTDFEIILVDDGSTDHSGKLCDRFKEKDTRIQVIHKENAGVSAARNDGIKKARGKYIQFVDSDDYLPQDFIKRLMESQEKYGENTIIFCGISIVYENAQEKNVTKYFRKRENCVIASTQDIYEIFDDNLLNAPYNKVFRRDIIINNNIYMDESLQIAEDLLFNIRYFKSFLEATKIVVENEVKYQYVQTGGNSLSSQYYEDSYSIHKRVLKELYEYGNSIQIPKDKEDIFYKKYGEYMNSAFYNYERKECQMSSLKKAIIRGKILRDKFFRRYLKLEKATMSRGEYYCMRTGSGILFSLYKKIRK